MFLVALVHWLAPVVATGFRAVVVSIGGLAAIAAAPAATAAEMKRVVVIETMTLPFLQSATESMRANLRELGHVEGGTISFEVLNADGNLERASAHLDAALAQGGADVIVTVATLASRAARRRLQGSGIPQVFMLVTDPVSEGFVDGIGQSSGSNITGRTHVVPTNAKLSVVTKSIANLLSKAPFRIGFLHSTYPSAVSDASHLEEQAASHPGLVIRHLQFGFVDGDAGRAVMRAAAVDLIKANAASIDGLWLAAGPNRRDRDYINAIAALDVPIIYGGSIDAVRAGALLSLISNAEINGRAVAQIVDAVLNGADAGQIPVTRPGRFSVGVNLATALRLGTVIPSEVLELAEGNIYR